MARRGPSKAARRKGGRAAARSRKSPIGRRSRSRRSSSRRRSGSRRSTRSKKRGRINVNAAIKRPGALGRRKKKGESTSAAARRLKRSGSPLAKRQANFYLNVLKGGRKKKR